MAGTGAKPLLPTWWVIAAAWLVMVILVGGTGPFQGHGWPEVSGDDAWRMVEVEDLINGQAWTDTVQHRDNTPYGSPMHWSRLIDAPLAGLTMLFRPLYGTDAPLAAASLWPLLVLIPFLILAVALGSRVAGPAARVPTLIVTLLALPSYTEFAPGRVDHHNVQMVLILALMLATVAGRTSTVAAAVAGLLAATCLAIGLECLPAVIAALALFPLFFAMDPAAARGPTISFAAAFAIGLAGHLLAVTDIRALWAPACDALSITYVIAGALYAVAVIGVAALGAGIRHPLLRFFAMAVAGAAALGIALAIFPACLAGPYGALDADLAKVLLTDISEAQPVWRWLSNVMGGAAGLLILPVVGLVGAVVAVWLSRGEKRLDWLVIAGFAVMLVLVMAVQVRGLRLAILPALPVGGWIFASAWTAFRARPGLPAFAGLAAGFLAVAGVAHVFAMFMFYPSPKELSERVVDYGACLEPASQQHLASLPQGRVISYLWMGPTILFSTPHSIVSAGYHRGEQGMRDALAFVSSDEATALRIARERDLDYLVFCRGVELNSGLHELPPFQGITAAGVRWPWLRPLSSPDEPVQIYAIDAAAN